MSPLTAGNLAHAPRTTVSLNILLSALPTRLQYRSIPAQLPLPPPNPQLPALLAFPCRHAQIFASSQTNPAMAIPVIRHVVASPSLASPATTYNPATIRAPASSYTLAQTPPSVPLTASTLSPKVARTHARPNTTAASASTPRAARTTGQAAVILTVLRARSARISTTTA